MEFKFLVGPEVVEAEKQLPKEQQFQWPFDSIVCYCTEGGKIIGRVAAMSIKILEGTWVAPDAPPTTAYRMLMQMEAMYAAYLGTTVGAFVSNTQPEIGDYLRRVGYQKEDVEFYTKPLAKAEEKTA